jgi:hypothetical protein
MVGICRGNEIWLVYVEVMRYGWLRQSSLVSIEVI